MFPHLRGSFAPRHGKEWWHPRRQHGTKIPWSAVWHATVWGAHQQLERTVARSEKVMYAQWQLINGSADSKQIQNDRFLKERNEKKSVFYRLKMENINKFPPLEWEHIQLFSAAEMISWLIGYLIDGKNAKKKNSVVSLNWISVGCATLFEYYAPTTCEGHFPLTFG